jgi:nucleoside-diphosphate-sugar epimerase
MVPLNRKKGRGGNMNRVLVTGAKGRVGKRVVQDLIAADQGCSRSPQRAE